MPFGELIAEYGVPHYLKIDIEGNDGCCVEALKGISLPEYVSVESECVGDSTVLSDDEATAMLELLRDVGYRRFKLVNQFRSWNSNSSNVAACFGKRAISKAVRGLARLAGTSAIVWKLAHSVPATKLGIDITNGSSGPWGNDAPGVWMSFEEARSTYLQKRHSFFAEDRPLYSFWHDWHATQ